MDYNDSRIFLTSGEGWIEEEYNSSDLLEKPNNITFINNFKKEIYQIMMPIVLLFCLASFLVSSFIVCSIPYVKRPMSPTIILSLSLSAANVAFSGTVFTAIMVHSYLPTVFEVKISNCLNLTIEALRMGVILVQVYHLLAVALIHYLGTLKPLQYASILTPYCLKVIVIILWTIPIAGIFIGFGSIPYQGFQSEACSNNHFRLNGIYFRYIWSLIYFGPTIGLIIIYVHIFIILSKREKNLNDSQHRKTIRRNLKTVKTTSLIVVTFLFGWTPAVLAFLLVCEDCLFQIHDLRVSMAIFTTTYILIILKVFVDTFIYALRLPEIREAVLLLYRGVVNCSLGSSHEAKRFRKSSTTMNSRLTYLNSIHSSSFDSQREKSLRKTFASSKKSNPHNTVEMKPLFENSVKEITVD